MFFYKQEVDPLSPITYIGCGVCIICVLFAIVALGVFKYVCVILYKNFARKYLQMDLKL